MNKSMKKLLKSILIAGAGAFLFQVATDAQNHDWGSYTPYVVALCTVIVNTVKIAGVETYNTVKKTK